MKTMQHEKVILKDSVVKKIFTSGTKTSKEYLLSIISALIDLPLEVLKQDFELITPEISVNKNIINSEADLVFENRSAYFSFEFNYNMYNELTNKNFSYMCQLYLRQIKNKNDYHDLKHIWQISLDNFDYFKEGRFVYVSEVLETTSYKSRNINIHIVDINLDYLENLEYTKVRKENILAKLLFIFVCNDEKILDQIYEGDKLMENVRKEIDYLSRDFDRVLFYDKKALDERMWAWESKQEGKREVTRNMLKKGFDYELISEITGFDDYDINKIKKEMEE